MPRWHNFSIWRGRLPHWRADGVWYYVTFRHRRPLSEDERAELFSNLVRQSGTKLEVAALCVLPESTSMIVALPENRPSGRNDLEDVVEKCKARAGKAIVKRTGERFAPFYSESYDRIVRDDEEMLEKIGEIARSPQEAGLCTDEDEYRFLWLTWNPSDENEPRAHSTPP